MATSVQRVERRRRLAKYGADWESSPAPPREVVAGCKGIDAVLLKQQQATRRRREGSGGKDQGDARRPRIPDFLVAASKPAAERGSGFVKEARYPLSLQPG